MTTPPAIPSDPTPTYEMLDGRMTATIQHLAEIHAGLDRLTGEQRVRMAELLNAHATPLIVGVTDLLRERPTAA